MNKKELAKLALIEIRNKETGKIVKIDKKYRPYIKSHNTA